MGFAHSESLQASTDFKVEIAERRSAPVSSRTINLYCPVNGERTRQSVTVGRPIRFDDIVVAVVNETSSPPSRELNWPNGLRGVARLAYHAMGDAKSRFTPALRYSSPVFDARRVEPNNISHLLLECIPMVLFAKEVLGANVVPVFGKVRNPFASFLEEFGIDAICTSKRIQGPIVHIRGSRNLQFYDLPGVIDCAATSFFPDIYDRFSFPNENCPSKIYLARRGVRSVLNNKEVERIVRARGYETIYMEDYSIREQLSMAQHAKHVVAVHGAAMALLAVNRGVDSLVEIFPPHVYHEHFAIGLPRVKSYAVLLSEFDCAVANCGWSVIHALKDAAFTVDLEMLERALDEI
ncbi:MAG: glycosyltransferase family 61 protein [Acidovorax sp.]